MITVVNDSEKKYFVEEGNVEFSENNLLILTTTVKEFTSIDKSFLESSLSESEKKMTDESMTDKERYILTHKINTLKEINQ